MAFFGTLWASIGTGGLLGWGEPLPTIATILIGAALVCGGIVLWRGAGRLPDTGAGEGEGNPMGAHSG